MLVFRFEDKYPADFKRLNTEWLQQYFVVEACDEYQLSQSS